MARTTNTSKRIASAAKKAVKAAKAASLTDICISMNEAAKNNKNRLPYGYVTKLLKELKSDLQWLTRNIINKAFLKYRMDLKNGTLPSSVQICGSHDESLSDISGGLENGTTATNPSTIADCNGSKKSKGGRPVGSTDMSKKAKELLLFKKKNIIAKRFAKVMKSNHGRLAKGTLDGIIREETEGTDLKNKILPDAIRQRFYRKRVVCNHVAGHVSPLEPIEQTVIDIILQMARIRQSITPSRGLLLVNSLIDKTPIQKSLVKWKRKYSNDTLGSVGKGYWDGFIRRNKHKLVSKRGQKYELNRQKWTTYANFVDMYSHTYQEIVDAGVAEELLEPVWLDRDGKECPEEKSFGCQVTHQLIHPELCICGDEVGGNLSMKGDGHVGGQLLLTAPGSVPQQKSSAKNRKFTLIGLTALTGEPVMCIIILEGKNPNASIEAGVDITVDPVGDSNGDSFLFDNSGPGNYFPGGPVCEFRGKKIPPFIRWHESGSITSQYLTEALQTLDYFNVFDRQENKRPFLLLDGHSSRLELPFLKYINTPKDHWVCCIGVPYGTALWQVGDSKEQNGSFNIAMSRAKQQLVEKKETMGLPPSLIDTDLMPIINMAWQQSFARSDKNKQAISDRGWNPLNRAILTNQDLRATMTAKEI